MGFRFVYLFTLIKQFTRFTFLLKSQHKLIKTLNVIMYHISRHVSQIYVNNLCISVGFIIVAPIISNVCADAEEPYNATGLEIRAIRINSLNSLA